ncbi:MAG: hypothetical protein NZ473_00815 [Candidatus Kapabacteria bacterium]|nr:hypothetical protein [Candidatus Kapabacteria bacterium]MCS7169061.1 hypothetical protein [Candidatus Kapabacteria bacterium]MDW8225115.1 hypothetical protein [Bacteroidota bacterium]
MRRWCWVAIGTLGAVLCGEAQQLELFTARQGVSPVLERARRDGFPDARLQAVLYAGDLPVSSPISLRFDLETGRANLWVYGVNSTQRDTTVWYAAVKLFVAFQVLPLPAIPLPVQQPLPESWMDSDSLVLVLRENRTYTEFRQRYPDSLPDAVILATSVLPGLPTVLPVWTMMFLGTPQELSTNMTCMVWKVGDQPQAECVHVVSVQEPSAVGVRLFPQPARGWVEVELPQPWCGMVRRGWLEDMLGRRVQQWEWVPGQCRGRLLLPHAPGVYSLRFGDGVRWLQVPVVIVSP